MIRDAAVFSLNEIVLRPADWPFFEQVAEEESLSSAPPSDPGVYLLALPRQYLAYPGGGSRVVYIGRARAKDGLKGRLREHLNFTLKRRGDGGDTGRYFSRYEWTAVHGIQATWSKAPDGAGDDKVDAVERKLLYWFAELYGAAPLGNAQAAWMESRPDTNPDEAAPPM